MSYYLHIVKCSFIDLPMFIWQDVYIAVSLLSPVCFVCFVALRPKSTAMVIVGRSVHLTTLFLGRLEQAVNQ